MTAPRNERGIGFLHEMSEFGSFAKGTQRYVRRSLDVGLGRRDAIRRWARHPGEAAEIARQARHYRRLAEIRSLIPDGIDVGAMATMMTPLVELSANDLAAGQLACFASYRFLYERLLGAAVRPWLPAAFCAAAVLPHLHPDRRRILLQSVSETVATKPGWSNREPAFYPEWVEKVDLVIAD